MNKEKVCFFKDVPEEKAIEITYLSDIEKPETQKKLQKIWESLGEKTLNPICRDSFLSYSNKLFLSGKKKNDEKS